MVNFGPITAENFWRVYTTPANFNGFRVLAALMQGTLAVDYCLLLMTLVLQLCSACNRRTINFYMMMMMMMMMMGVS